MHLVVIQVEFNERTGQVGLKTSLDAEGGHSCDPFEKEIADRLFLVMNGVVKHFGQTLNPTSGAHGIVMPGDPGFGTEH